MENTPDSDTLLRGCWSQGHVSLLLSSEAEADGSNECYRGKHQQQNPLTSAPTAQPDRTGRDPVRSESLSYQLVH
jgi:hypothetical protein